MTADRFARIKCLFDEVCDLSEPARDTRLRELAGDDPSLAEEIRSLLARVSPRHTVFVRPVQRLLDSLAGDELATGDTLGVWTLAKKIGRGGMGAVFRAHRADGVFEQIVAIKLLRGIASPDALGHLARERQIQAGLSHPNIARLFDGGATPQGRPYLVMEYVDGVPIDQHCRERGLSQAAVLELFVTICGAVGFAHRHLIVHCDLKPSNILVTPDGRPVLLDFGIAHRLAESVTPDGSSETAERSHAYTPGYASPEQHRGDLVTAATDLYGLGRVLVDLLAAPERESTHDAGAATRLPGPLAAIVRHATADDPDRRYASAHALAEDVRRYLDGRPVLAMGNRRAYQLRCHLRRHGLAFGLGALSVLMLLGGLIATTLSLNHAREERARAEIATARATRTADFLSELLGGVDPNRARDLDRTLLRELLDQASVEAKTELTGEPQVLAQIEKVIGHTYAQLSEYTAAVAHLESALALLPAGQVRERLDLREAIVNARAPTQAAKEALRDSQALHRERLQAFGPDDTDTLKSASQVAWQHVLNGDFSLAAEQSADLAAHLESRFGPDDPVTLENLRTLAHAHGDSGEFDAAEAVSADLVQRHLRIHGEGHSRTLAAQINLVILNLRRQRYAEAEALLHPMYRITQQRYGPRHHLTINIANLLGGALRQGGKLAESEPYYRLSHQGALELYGESNASTLAYALNYANYETDSGDAAAALRRLEAIGPGMAAAFGDEHPNLAEWQRSRARALTVLKRVNEARAAWRHALDIDRRAFGSDAHPQVVKDLAGLNALQ